MKIIVDSDGCPVKEIIMNIAKKYEIELLFVMNIAHFFSPLYGEVKYVDKSRERADIVIANIIKKGDLVVTQDYGLAAMILAKHAYCINQNGMIFDNNNIDVLLARRHFNREMRVKHKKYTKVAKRKKEDDIKFEEALNQLLKNVLE